MDTFYDYSFLHGRMPICLIQQICYCDTAPLLFKWLLNAVLMCVLLSPTTDFSKQQAGNIISAFLQGQFHCCDIGLFMLKWQSIITQFLPPSLGTDSNASFSPCLFCNHYSHDTWISFSQVFHIYASISPSPHLVPPISWMTPPSKSSLGFSLCTHFAFSPCLHCFELLQMFSASKSAHPYDILKGWILSGVFPCVEA